MPYSKPYSLAFVILLTLFIVSDCNHEVSSDISTQKASIVVKVQSLQQPQSLSNILKNSKKTDNIVLNQEDSCHQKEVRALRETEQSTPTTRFQQNSAKIKVNLNNDFVESDSLRIMKEKTQGNSSRKSALSEEDFEAINEIFIIDISEFSSEENLVVIVENNYDPSEIPDLIGDEHPITVHEEDLLISSWWTVENEEYGFEDWEDLELYLESEYGENPRTHIDTNAEDLPIDLELSIIEDNEVESVVEIQGRESHQFNLEVLGQLFLALSISTSRCAHIVVCENIVMGRVGEIEVCKNQLVCPNTQEVESESDPDSELEEEEEH